MGSIGYTGSLCVHFQACTDFLHTYYDQIVAERQWDQLKKSGPALVIEMLEGMYGY